MLHVVPGHRPLPYYGAPQDGVDAEQNITIGAGAAAGNWRLSFAGFETANLAHNAAHGAVEAALNALPSIGAGGVTVTDEGTHFKVAFDGAAVAKKTQPDLVVSHNSLVDGGAVAVAITITEETAGVTATWREAPTGAMIIDTETGNLYINEGYAQAPQWMLMAIDAHTHLLAAGATDVTATAAELNEVTDGSTTALHEHELAEGANDVTASAAEVNTLDGISATTAQLNSLAQNPGARAFGVLRVAGNVADGEQVEIGADVYEVEVVNTDSTDNTADGSWDNVTDPLTVDLAAYTNVDGVIGVGDLIRIEDEIMKCTAIDGTEHTFSRGRSNTAAAAHADGDDIYISAAPGGPAAPPAEFLVGLVATLTPAVFTPALVAEINAEASEAVTAQTISNNQALVVANAPGVVTLALAESLMTADNEWDTAAMRGGAAPSLRRIVAVSRVPNATEVALDRVLIPLDFAPSLAIVQIRATTSGVSLAFDGNVLLRSVEQRVDVINDGIVDFDADDTITVVAFE